jgi:hypothetical protein
MHDDRSGARVRRVTQHGSFGARYLDVDERTGTLPWGSTRYGRTIGCAHTNLLLTTYIQRVAFWLGSKRRFCPIWIDVLKYGCVSGAMGFIRTHPMLRGNKQDALCPSSKRCAKTALGTSSFIVAYCSISAYACACAKWRCRDQDNAELPECRCTTFGLC